MSQKTAQSLGYEWDHELARLVGGKAHMGSGNRPFQRLDASGHSLVLSGKFTTHRSFSIAEDDLDEMVRATVGPEAASTGVIPILAVKFASGRMVATIDLETLLEWIRQPPELIPSTKQDALLKTAKTPSFLRE